MQCYKLKLLNGQNIATQMRDFEGPDDLAALAAAERLCATQNVEIWQGARRVARVKMGNAALTATDHESL